LRTFGLGDKETTDKRAPTRWFGKDAVYCGAVVAIGTSHHFAAPQNLVAFGP
jgi:hypothetical protein